MRAPFVVWLHTGYAMVHRSDCRHLKNRRPDDRRLVDIMHVDTPIKANISGPVCYCRVCNPREMKP